VLTDRYAYDLDRLLVPREAYHPFPTASERGAWEALPAEAREAAIEAGEKLLGYAYPPLPATLYMDFFRTGDRARFERPYFQRRSALDTLVIAECMEGKGRFLDDIVNGVWAMCEEASWVLPAHNLQSAGGRDALPDLDDPWVDLMAGETAALLAWTHYLLRDQLAGVSRHLLPLLRREVKARILDPFLRRDDFWWMGITSTHLNNWSPWCASNCLVSFLLLEEDGARRLAGVRKAMEVVDRWLAGYPPDGGCDEGPSYWGVAGGSLCDCLELLSSASGGKILIYDRPLIQEIGRYLHRAHISGDYYLDFADCPAKVHPAAGLVYRYGKRIGDEGMAALGAWAYQRHGVHRARAGNLLRTLPSFFFTEGIERPGQPPLLRDVWLPDTQVMAAREQGGSDRGFYLAAKGGHNDESHNHNDAGQFLVYYDGQPVLIDAGVGTYTAKTFSPQRYEIWTMQSAYHNLPTVNGAQQREGREFRATEVTYRMDEAKVEFSLDLAGAYPREAGLASWRRTCRLLRGETPRVEIEEAFSLAAPTDDVALSLLTACEPQIGAADALLLPCSGTALRLSYPADLLEASIETLVLDDDHLRSVWGERLWRIVLRSRARVQDATWRLTITGP